MRPLGRALLSRTATCVGLLLLLQFVHPGSSLATSQPAWRAGRPWLSSSGEALFRQSYAAGQFKDHPLARWYAGPAEPVEPAVHVGGDADALALPTTPLIEFAADALANDRNPLTCTGCQNLGISQCEATVALDGLNVLVGWNDLETRCFSTSRQNFGWSTDGGATFTDGGHYPPTNVGGRLFGDASHAVNHKTHDFYVAGLHGSGGVGGAPPFTGVGAVKGHFGPPGFVIDLNRLVVINPSPQSDFFDKPWMTVDSLSGNVYFVWTNFSDLPYLEFQAFDANLNPLGPIQRFSDDPCGVQFGVPAVGPDGELYVMWRAYDCASGLSSVAVRKSTDFGVSFGPRVLVAPHALNSFTGGPGFLRPFASTQPSITVDRTDGPYRGRVYTAWDECVDYLASRSETTSAVDTEPNDTVGQAQTFVPGGKLRGTKNGLESDWYRFDAMAGQTFYAESVISFEVPGGYDSTRTGVDARLYCREPDGTLSVAVNGTLTSSGMIYTLKETATYYLEILGTSSEVSPYVAWTNLVTAAPGERARDHRDQAMSWSDDGITWSGPQRIVDSAIGYDAQYPWLAVDGKGRVHCSWMDFRIDSRCNLPRSIQVVTSSGDGGVAWGPNRTFSDEPSFWNPNVCQSNGNNQGDYQHMVADGDRLVTAFTDQRLGDPDIFVDAAVYRALAGCPGPVSFATNQNHSIEFSLTNDGNFPRQLAWRLEDTRGWLTGGIPGVSGSQLLGVGQTITLTAMLQLQNCVGDSSVVSLIHSDPAIPGFEESCPTVVRCTNPATPVLVSLVESRAEPGLVTITWYAPLAARAHATVWRRHETAPRTMVGPATVSGEGYLTFEDRDDLREGRYAYRLELELADGPYASGETWVEIRLPRFALEGARPNPTPGVLTVTLSLEHGAATLELHDVAGRRVLAREVGGLGPGRHHVQIGERASLPAGVYTMRLMQGGRSATAQTIVVR